MDFDLDEIIELSEEQKEIDNLFDEYYKRGFKQFNTWYMEDKKIKEILQNCLEQNKSYEKIYGEDKISDNLDY